MALWRGVRKTSEAFTECLSFNVGVGKEAAFWDDKWLGIGRSREAFPDLYEFSRGKNCSVALQFSLRAARWRVKFGERLLADDRAYLQILLTAFDFGPSFDGEVTPLWEADKEKRFTVRSFYRPLRNEGNHCPYVAHLWKARVPLKVKVFTWIMLKNRLLTTDNILKRIPMGEKDVLLALPMTPCNVPNTLFGTADSLWTYGDPSRRPWV